MYSNAEVDIEGADDSVPFFPIVQGACSCCGLSHHNLAVFMQDCSDIGEGMATAKMGVARKDGQHLSIGDHNDIAMYVRVRAATGCFSTDQHPLLCSQSGVNMRFRTKHYDNRHCLGRDIKHVCCVLTHSLYKILTGYLLLNTPETDDGRKERKSPWPPAMSDEVWTARVKVRAAMKGEMPRYHEVFACMISDACTHTFLLFEVLLWGSRVVLRDTPIFR